MMKVYFNVEDRSTHHLPFVDGLDRYVYDSCFDNSSNDPSNSKLLVMCREGCGITHTHIPLSDQQVGVMVSSDSTGIIEVGFDLFIYLLISHCVGNGQTRIGSYQRDILENDFH